MKTMMIAALAAAQLSAAASPARAADPPPEAPAAARQEADPHLAGSTALEPGASEVLRLAEPAREEKPRKRKSTGDKILTGAAVVLGIGALAMGGLMIAIFAN